MQNQIMKLMCFNLVFFWLFQLNAQERRTELGLVYNTETGYNLLMKQQLKYNQFLRVSLEIPNANFAYSGGNQNVFSAFNVGLSLGFEFHIPLAKRFTLYHGPEVTSRFSNYRAQDYYSNSIFAGIGYFTGLIFKLNDRLSLFGEVKHSFNFLNQSRERAGQGLTSVRSNYYFDSNLTFGATFNLKRNKRKKIS